MKKQSAIQALLNQYERNERSIVTVVQESLRKAEEAQKTFKPFLSLRNTAVLHEAAEYDRMKSTKRQLPLFGIPYAVKDNILCEGESATAASLILKEYRATYSATVINKMRSAGALLIGKTNLDEFAMGSSTENSAFGPSVNPHDPSRVPGGSSGGSAVATALSVVPFALGSDTGGSVRQPASFCGVYGLKPTYGSVSRFGLMAMASSLDVIGVFSSSADDVFTVFEVIKGSDPFDMTSQDFNRVLPQKPLRVCYLKEYFQGCDTEVQQAIVALLHKLSNAGIVVEEVTVPLINHALPCYYIIMASEVSSNLARYDGVKFGARVEKEKELWEMYLETRAQYLGAEVKRRILTGAFTLSYGYFDAYYNKALKVRDALRSSFEHLFSTYDLVLGPTAPEVAFSLGDKSNDPIKMYLSDIYTVPANLGGFPALSIPIGNVRGLPVGLQAMAERGQEQIIHKFTNLLEDRGI